MSVVQAEKLVKEGKKKIKGGFFGNLMSSKNDRMSEAIELFKEAASQYKVAGKSTTSFKLLEEEACDCLRTAAGMYEGLEEWADAAQTYNEAGDILIGESPAQANELYQGAAKIFIKSGKIADAAKAYRQISEVYEKDLEWDLAAENLKEAARLFEMEKFHKSDYEKASLKVATLLTRD